MPFACGNHRADFTNSPQPATLQTVHMKLGLGFKIRSAVVPVERSQLS